MHSPSHVMSTMTLTPTIQSTLQRYRTEILKALRHAKQRAAESAIQSEASNLTSFYGQMQYHLGWVNTDFTPATSNPGELLRPTFLLLAYEATSTFNPPTDTAAHNANLFRRALAAADAVVFHHTFPF